MAVPSEAVALSLRVKRLSWALGAEVVGIDMREPPSPALADALRRALADHGLLLFRDQPITPAQQIAFMAALGPLIGRDPLLAKHAHPEHPDILLVTNIRNKDGMQSATATTGRQWHADQSYLPKPTLGCMLRCIEAPALGGTTYYNNMSLAYETLSDAMKAVLRRLRAMHNYLNYREHANRPKLEAEIVEAIPAVKHPVVIRNPTTGRLALFVNEMMVDRFAGMTPAESCGLLDYLNRHATQPAFTYQHRWRPNDCLLWDNHAVMHYAPADYDFRHPELPGNRRVMHRTTFAGQAPIPA
ncbi:MAG: TauD/TfdA family dioxygenase [Alphaproteobacteria bacterium]